MIKKASSSENLIANSTNRTSSLSKKSKYLILLLTAIIIILITIIGVKFALEASCEKNTILLKKGNINSGKPSIHSDIPFTFTINNLFKDDLTLFWIGFGGKIKYYSTIPSGSQITQESFVSHRWLLMSEDQDYIKEFELGVDDSFKNSNDIFDAIKFSEKNSGKPSIKSDVKFYFSIVNKLKTDLNIFWIDYNGKMKYYITISPDSKLDQESFVGHRWLLMDQNENYIKEFDLGNDDSLKKSEDIFYAIIFENKNSGKPSLESDVPFIFNIENRLKENLNLFWINFEGKMEFYASIPARYKFSEKSFESHRWLLMNENEDYVKEFNLGNDDYFKKSDDLFYAILFNNKNSGKPSIQSNVTFKFTINNRLKEDLNIFWINFEGKMEFYAPIYLRTKLNLESFMSHRWIIMNQDEDYIKEFELGTDDSFKNSNDVFYAIKFNNKNSGEPSIKSDEPFNFTIDNRLEENLNIFWINFEGKMEYNTTLTRGSNIMKQSFASHRWLIMNEKETYIKEFQLGVDDSFKKSNDVYQVVNFDIVNSGKPSIKSDEPFKFNIVNKFDENLYLFWINFKGVMELQRIIPIGASETFDSFILHRWMVISADQIYNKEFEIGVDLHHTNAELVIEKAKKK